MTTLGGVESGAITPRLARPAAADWELFPPRMQPLRRLRQMSAGTQACSWRVGLRQYQRPSTSAWASPGTCKPLEPGSWSGAWRRQSSASKQQRKGLARQIRLNLFRNVIAFPAEAQ